MTGSHSLQNTVRQLRWLRSCFLVGLGCSTSSTAPPAAGPVGNWELLSVNGALVPALLVTARYNQQIVGEVILLRPDYTYATFTVERFFTGTAPPAAADTVYNLGYWNNTGGALVIGVIDASQSGDTLRISSGERGLSMYARQ